MKAERSIMAAVILVLSLTVVSVPAGASLMTIGTADYNSSTYNLIYDNDSPFGSIVYLDYTSDTGKWSRRVNWASSLNDPGVISNYVLNSGYSMNWGGSSWRLPISTQDSGTYQTWSEMGHLWYTELGNPTGSTPTTGVFSNLQLVPYWSGTESNVSDAWYFSINNGGQSATSKINGYYALAVRFGQLETSTVPEPSTYVLMCLSLGVVGYARKRMVK